MRHKEHELGRKLRMTLYESSEGPCVTLFGPMNVELDALRDLFGALSHGGGPVQLDEMKFIVSFGGIRILARCLDVTSGGRSTQRAGIFKRADAKPAFVWTQARDAWGITAELVQGLIDSAIAGHQYLSDNPADDAVVVVSKGEFSDSILREA